MILTVGGIKGGSGKTTIATNLAVMRALAGRDVLLIDADDQETATDFTALRSDQAPNGAGYTSIKLTDKAVLTETQKLRDKYQDVIIDTGGRDTTSQRAALVVSDVLLVPFVPRSFDVWTVEKVAALIEEMRVANQALKALAFINRGDARGSDNQDAAGVLRECEAFTLLDATLGQRKAFGNAAAAGLAVCELKPPDAKASEEMERLYQLVFNSADISGR